MKQTIFFALLLLSFTLLVSCEKKDSAKEPELGSLYGVVTDKTTGDPVKNAGVELMPLGLKAVTGDDGQFEFAKVEEGTYNLYITKSGYQNLKTSNVIIKGNGENKPVNIQIEKLPPALSILDDKGNEVDSLDFGENPEVLMHSFFIFNGGEETLEWAIVHQCAWISSVSKESGSLASNGTQPLVIQIDRNKLSEGQNFTTIHILSNSGTRQITLSAAFNVKLETLTVSDICANSAVMNGRISQDFSPSVIEYGFVYAKFAAPSKENGAMTIALAGTPPIGSIFSMVVPNLKENTEYHVRAYATNGIRTMYGNEAMFSTKNGLPTVITTNPNDSITATTIIMGGNVINDGGFAITSRGVVYGTVPYPTIDDNEYTSDGSGIGYYKSTITNIDVTSKIYYLRAYATNEKGTSYGEQIVITPEHYDYCVNLKTMEYGGNLYKIKYIGSMTWTNGINACENLNYGGYSDWYMPDGGEVREILKAYEVWGIRMTDEPSKLYVHNEDKLWTSEEEDEEHAEYYQIFIQKWGAYSNGNKNSIFGVFAVRVQQKRN